MAGGQPAELAARLRLRAASATPGASDADRHELGFTRDQVATRMAPVEVLVLAGILREAADRLALDPATRSACSRWSSSLAGLLSAPPELAIAS
jgi:hypothetical protein